MKGSIFTVLQDFEKLIYKILIWIILLPKTIYQITVDPKWAPGYIHDELDESNPANHGQVQFDEYMSPIILLLVVALLPALGSGLLPKFGAALTSSAQEKPTTDRFISFESQTDFVSSSDDLKYSHFWIVDRKLNDGSYDLVADELHNDYSEKNYLEVVDNNTVNDKFLYTFNEPGEYLVTVQAKKYDSSRQESGVTEFYSAALAVNVPLDITEPIIILDTNAKTESAPDTKATVDFSDRVKQEDTLFLALALMIPPLLFAFVIKIRTRKRGEIIGENTLKESFYVQCYFFSPLSMAIWATYYARYFFTADAYGYRDYGLSLVILLLPALLAVLWFFRIEMQVVINPELGNVQPKQEQANELQTPEKLPEITSIKAFLIVVGCLLLLGSGGYLIYDFKSLQDGLRLTAIRMYPVGAIGLIVGFTYGWSQRRKAEGKRITVRNFGWTFAGFIMLTVMYVVIRYVLYSPLSLAAAPPPEVVAAPLSTATLVMLAPPATSTETPEPPTPQVLESPTANVAPQNTDSSFATEIPATSTPLPTETPVPPTATLAPQQYYTENFDSDLANWSQFMSSGDPIMVERHSEPGKYAVNLLELEGKLARYYLINDGFTYSDVKIETVVVNRGNNTNGVSLICRYSDVGWYEFLVSNGGTYFVYAVDRAGIVNSGYNLIDQGTSILIKSGLGAVNTYTITCKGQELSLSINNQLVDTLTETKFQFQEGKAGLGVSSPEKLPVKIEFDSFTVSEP